MNSGQFQPGQSGNPGGRPKQAKQFRDALLRQLDKAGDDGKKLDSVARRLVENAIGGETAAIREIADRIDGKVPQAHVGDEDGPPIAMTIQGLFQRIAESGKRIHDKD